MATDNKKEFDGHHEKVSHAGEKPDQFVEYSEKLIDFSRRNAVTITLIAVTIVVGIIMVAKFANDAGKEEKNYCKRVSQYEYSDFQAVELAPDEKKARAETFIVDNFKTLCENNLDHDKALGTLVALGTRAELTAEQFLSENNANAALWAWQTILEKFSDSELAKAVDPNDQENILNKHIVRMNNLLTQIQDIKQKAGFDPEGLSEAVDPYAAYRKMMQ